MYYHGSYGDVRQLDTAHIKPLDLQNVGYKSIFRRLFSSGSSLYRAMEWFFLLFFLSFCGINKFGLPPTDPSNDHGIDDDDVLIS